MSKTFVQKTYLLLLFIFSASGIFPSFDKHYFLRTLISLYVFPPFFAKDEIKVFRERRNFPLTNPRQLASTKEKYSLSFIYFNYGRSEAGKI